MNRRNFIQTLVGGVAGIAAARTFPFRVFIFPSEIKIIGQREFEEAYVSGRSGKFAELLAPGLRLSFIDWVRKTNPDEFAYGNDDIRIMMTPLLGGTESHSPTV